MNKKNVFHILCCCALIGLSFSILALPKLYDVVVSTSKNKYTVTAPTLNPAKVNTLGMMLTIAVDQPKKETIMITSSDADGRSCLGGDQIEGFLNSSHPELASTPKLVGGGVQLDIKASDKQVVIKIPVTMLESTTTTFKVKRGKRTVDKLKATYIRKDKPDLTEEDGSDADKPIVSPTSQKKLVNQATTSSLNMFSDMPQQPTMLTATRASQQLSTQTKMMPLNNPSSTDNQGTTRQVANYEQLVAAIQDTSVNRIEFLNQIAAEGSNALPPIKRSLVIDGRGNTFWLTGYKVADVFCLSDNMQKQKFTVTNMKIERENAKESDYFIKVPLSNKFGGNWEVNLENIEVTETSKSHGGLVYNHSGSTFLRGKIVWSSPDSGRDREKQGEFLKFEGVINSQHIKITKSDDGREPDIKIHTNGPALRAYRYGDDELSSVIIEAGKVDLHSRNGQAVYINAEDSLSAAVFEVKGKNTDVKARGSQATSRSQDHGDYAGSGVIAIVGNNETGPAKGRSHTTISGGAKLYVKALESINGKADSAILHQVKSGTFTITGKDTKLTCEAENPNGNETAVLRFRIHGNQTLNVADGAKLEINRLRGRSSTLRFTNEDNVFRISGGSLVEIYNKGSGETTDGGQNGGRQGIEYANTETGNWKGPQGIYLDGENSRLYVRADGGPAVESGNSPFNIEANQRTTLSLVGRSRTYDGAALKFRAQAALKIKLDTPYFYEFINTRPSGKGGGGRWLSQVVNSEMVATNTAFQAWRRGWELVYTKPALSYAPMSYHLKGFGFRDVKRATNNAFADYVTDNNGIAQQFTKVTGMALEAKLENLRQPTNADKHIYGQITVPRRYDKDGPTDYQPAKYGEVWVKLRLYRLKFKKGVTAPKGDPSKNIEDFDNTYEVKTYDKELPTMGWGIGVEGLEDHGVSQFGEPKTYGVFDWNLENDDNFKGEDNFLWAGDFVEVINIRTSWQQNQTPFDIVTQKYKFQTKGRYVFNVMPVEVTPDVTQGHIDPVLDATTAQATMSDVTKSLRMQSNVRSIRKHAAVVPLEVTYGNGVGKESIITGSNGKNSVSFYPMLSVKDNIRTNPKPDTISLYQQDSQKSQLNLYSYLSPDEVDGKTAELFAFSDWDADISSLGKDLPPTYQKLTDITTTDKDNAFSEGGNKKTLYGLKMPNRTEPVIYHDVTFSPAPQLNIESFAPTSLETSLTKEGDGKLDTVDLNGKNVVSYQVKLTNPEIGKFPNQLVLGYAMTFEVSGNAEIFDEYSGIGLVDGVSAEVSNDKKKVTLTANDTVKLGDGIDIPVAVSGDFKIKVTAWGRTLQEKTYSLPRGSWDVSEEGHNFDQQFIAGLEVPNRNLSDYVTYYRRLKAKEVTQPVTTTERTPSSKVYLSIADGKLTIYYRQLKGKTKVKVTVDGKALTEFKVNYSDVEQAKPLNLKLDGVRNIVKVSYTDTENNTKTVTWKNPKIRN